MRRPITIVLSLAIAGGLGAATITTGCSSTDDDGYRVVRREPPPEPRDQRNVKRRPTPRDNGDPGLRRVLERRIDGDGVIAYLGKRAEGDQRFGPLEKRIRIVDDEPFAARDGAAARKMLADMGATHLIVSALDPPITPWPSKGRSTIHELLRDGVPPPGFQPIAIARAHYVYRLAPDLEFTQAQRRSITAYIRAKLTKREDVPDLDLPPDELARQHDGKVRVVVALRGPEADCHRGVPLRRQTGEATTLRGAIDDAIRGLERGYARARHRSNCREKLPSSLRAAMSRLTIQVEVIHRMAAVTDRTRSRLYWLYELGRDGASLQRDGRTLLMTPSRAIWKAFAGEHRIVQRVGEWNGEDRDTWLDEDWELGRFETRTWIELEPGDDPIALYRGTPLITVPSINKQVVVDALVNGARFLIRNQGENGEYRYLYHPLRDRGKRWSTKNNIVRHSLCPMVMAKVLRIHPDDEIERSIRRGIDHTLQHLVRIEEGNRCVIEYQGEADRPNRKMGTVAGMVMSILQLARSADISEYTDELECFANQILAMQEPSGEFTHYDVPRSHPYYGRHNTIYPGELMLALSNLYEYTHDERYRQAFDRAMEFQQRWFRETREMTTDDGIYEDRRRQDLIAFEPWGIMAMNDMHRQTNDSRYADFAFELVDFVDGWFQWDLERAYFPDYLGGYFKTQLELPAINSCGYTEGAAAMYAIALRTGRRVEERRQALLLGIRFVLQLQYTDRNMFYLTDPETARGGFRYNLSQSRVRNDYMYHAMNALALAAVTLRDEDYPPHVRFESIPEIHRPAFEGYVEPDGAGPAPASGDAGPGDGGPAASPLDGSPATARDASATPATSAPADARPARGKGVRR